MLQLSEDFIMEDKRIERLTKAIIERDIKALYVQNIKSLILAVLFVYQLRNLLISSFNNSFQAHWKKE